MKLAVLGGGGVRSPFLAKSISLSAKELDISEVVFMDIDREKLLIYGKIAKKTAKIIAPDLNFVLTTDADEALKDTDFIITTIRARSDEGRVFDERTALNLGLLGQETTGAGGFAMALRSIHIMKEYCEKAKKLSKPNAPIFNFTNPSGLVTQAMHSYGYDNVYGVCDAPSGFIRQLKDISGNDNLSVKCFGLNHLSWFYDFKIDGKDVTDEILSNKKLYTDTEMRLFDKELISMCENFLPNEYLYFYYYREKAIESVLSSKKTRGETICEINKNMMKELKEVDIDKDFDKAFHIFMSHYAMRENSYFSIESGTVRNKKFSVPTVDEYISQEDEGGYAGVALDYIRAKNSENPTEMVLSVPNGNAVDFLKSEDVCEISCTIDSNGVHPHKVGYIPEMCKNIIRTVKQYENLTVEAIIEKNKQKAVQALMIHPLVSSYSLAEKLVDTYTEEYKEFIGEWK